MILEHQFTEYACGSCGYHFYRITGRERISDSFCPECGSLRAKRAESVRKSLRQHSPKKTGTSPDSTRLSPER
jgi:predicted RNA-binding Zn-ribbon protein involved in translation (DUF1610 family)